MIRRQAMIGVIVTAFVSFISTNIDDIFILMIFFSQTGNKFKKRHIIIGQYLGIMTLLFISILGSIGLNLIPQQYIGLLGIIPILLGIKEWLKYRKEIKEIAVQNLMAEENSTSGKMTDDKNINIAKIQTTKKEKIKIILSKLIHPAIINVFLVTISNGADNVGVYIPLFTPLNLLELIVTVIIFLLLIAVWCFVSERLMKIPTIKHTIQKYKNIIVPVVFIAIGIYIIVESDLFSLFG
jgi:cadmium resistance protein CadD (predicted permease)